MHPFRVNQTLISTQLLVISQLRSVGLNPWFSWSRSLNLWIKCLCFGKNHGEEWTRFASLNLTLVLPNFYQIMSDFFCENHLIHIWWLPAWAESARWVSSRWFPHRALPLLCLLLCKAHWSSTVMSVCQDQENLSPKYMGKSNFVMNQHIFQAAWLFDESHKSRN